MKTIPIAVAPQPGGVGLKGCSHIYAPAGQAGEYAPLACNIYRGCGHECVYCYVPGVLKMTRKEFDAGAAPRKGFSIHGLKRDAAKYRAAGIDAQIMLSFTSDPYHLGDTALTKATLIALRESGMAFCTLTKGGARALRDIDLFRPERDAFASTLTSINDEFSLKFERKAAPASERIATLRKFHDRGVFTWVSLEPTLSIEESLAVVRETYRFVDLYKIGRANYMGAITRETNWEMYTWRMTDLCRDLGVQHYIKRDLQAYLPAGYHNPMRVRQHH